VSPDGVAVSRGVVVKALFPQLHGALSIGLARLPC
jgi:hypothetical protein